jgi:hypothetical protein
MKVMVLMEIFLIALLLLSYSNVLVMADVSAEPHAADAVWVEPSSIVFTNSNASVGTKFNVTVWLNMTEKVFNYQVALYYNRTQLMCTRGGFTGVTRSNFMTGHTTSAIGPQIDTSYLGNGSVLATETCLGSDFAPGPNVGSLLWLEFQIMIVPTAGNVTSTFDLSTTTANGDTWVSPNGGVTTYNVAPYDGAYAYLGPTPTALSVSITPASSTIFEGGSVTFGSSVTGGAPPYTYQWYQNGTSVPSATSNTWIFTPPTSGFYTVYLNVTDNAAAPATSNTANVTAVPKGELAHDVAVVGVIHSILGNTSRSWVYQGISVKINVTVENNGGYDESVNVTLYYNITANQKVDTQTISLDVGKNTTIVFTWNTKNIPYWYNYTMTAVADINLDATPADNTLTDGNIEVRIPGDIYGRGYVDGSALGKIVFAFASFGPNFLYIGSPAHPRWNADSDVNGDGKVDGKDLGLAASSFGKHFP